MCVRVYACVCMNESECGRVCEYVHVFMFVICIQASNTGYLPWVIGATADETVGQSD